MKGDTEAEEAIRSAPMYDIDKVNRAVHGIEKLVHVESIQVLSSFFSIVQISCIHHNPAVLTFSGTNYGPWYTFRGITVH